MTTGPVQADAGGQPDPFVLRSIDGQPDPKWLERVGDVVPVDELRERRLANLARARQVVAAYDGEIPVGLVFVRTVVGVPNVTWLVAERARRRGLAVRMLTRLQRDWRMLTAICRNEASVKTARRAGFWMAGPFALWLRR
jgi:hypothetical protein